MCPSVRVEVSRAEADNDIVHCCQSLPTTTVTRTPSTVSNSGGQVGFNSSVFLIIGRLILERKNWLSSSIQALGINYHKTLFILNYANLKHVFYYIPFMEMWEWRTQKESFQFNKILKLHLIHSQTILIYLWFDFLKIFNRLESFNQVKMFLFLFIKLFLFLRAFY